MHFVPRNVGRAAVSVLAALALAFGLLVASGGAASAASDRTWQKLSRCESGARWHINTGNGYHGGLQFSSSTWRGYGGKRFARYADNAKRRQQIVIAERVLKGQGWGAWPSCSRKLGLGGKHKRVKWQGFRKSDRLAKKNAIGHFPRWWRKKFW
ncbi:transglycosylase-like protein with SLT domain [Mumia flava]|uniref:Transglycosylase-like protein with SLT domain n=1 Tax=Mumia flava TaxID=1348852 RepID=A0A2M9B6N7_9ACTN|nr:transglycosylase family protein [Mumia flava]PJJ53626.1 transglycosylase-like protein with SLT domain [Mumia flava]